MNAFIEHDQMMAVVKVWLYNRDANGGTIFMWPTHRAENGDMVWMQEIVAEGVQRPDHIHPALEMSRHMWDAFVKALRATELEKPAGKLLAQVLEREQNRVDALITALLKTNEPQWIMTKPMEGP